MTIHRMQTLTLNQNVLKTIHLNLKLLIVVVRSDITQVKFIDHQIGMDCKLFNLHVVEWFLSVCTLYFKGGGV